MRKEKTDVLVVGAGVAGLYLALNLPEQVKVRVIAKDQLEISDSYLAQGGIATLRDQNDYEDYFEDTLKAGHYKNRLDSVRIMIQESNEIIEELLSYGVEFERSQEGLIYTKEGGHSKARILHHKDITGKEITSKLLSQAKKRKNIRLDIHMEMLDVIAKDNICKGVLVKSLDQGWITINAKVVIFATGGIGGLFQNTTNYEILKGDAIAIALRNKIALQDIHCIQIHPTALYSRKEGRKFLISESVRGEGAILLNPVWKRFINELEPRDVVAAAIKEEMDKFNSPYVYLSLGHMDGARIRERFPSIYQKCSEEGYDFTKDFIPVTPAQHYLMGGIQVDLDGKTSMDHLFAVGETSCNGVHGANRLGSNSLLESLVFARRAAKKVQSMISRIPLELFEGVIPTDSYNTIKEKDRQLILDEIKRKDRNFYELWCDGNQLGRISS